MVSLIRLKPLCHKSIFTATIRCLFFVNILSFLFFAPVRIFSQSVNELERERFLQNTAGEGEKIHWMASSHWLYGYIPCHRNQLTYNVPSFLAWMIFGNDDDGIFGENQAIPYLPKNNLCFGKAVRWWLRNPFHNFCFYVIGSAGRENHAITLMRLADDGCCCFTRHGCKGKTFVGNTLGFQVTLNGGKPFISLRWRYCKSRHFIFYLGWRPGGSFGIKLHPFAHVRNAKQQRF